MSFEHKLQGVEDFVDYSANVGVAVVWGAIISTILSKPLKVGIMIPELIGLYLARLVRAPYLIHRRVKLFKAVGVKCEGCGSWVSKDITCPLCGADHKATNHMNTKEALRDNHTHALTVVQHTTEELHEYDSAKDIYSMVDVMRAILFDGELSDSKKRTILIGARLCADLGDNCEQKMNNEEIVRYLKSALLDAAKSSTDVCGLDMAGKHVARLTQSYQYDVYGVNKAVPEDKMLRAGHPQELTRSKYERVRCPKCDGISRVRTQYVHDQIRECTTCGNQFTYSSGVEAMVKVYEL